jgi:hypothetical protein
MPLTASRPDAGCQTKSCVEGKVKVLKKAVNDLCEQTMGSACTVKSLPGLLLQISPGCSGLSSEHFSPLAVSPLSVLWMADQTRKRGGLCRLGLTGTDRHVAINPAHSRLLMARPEQEYPTTLAGTSVWLETSKITGAMQPCATVSHLTFRRCTNTWLTVEAQGQLK